MKEEKVTDALLREFLLGKVDDKERERIEDLFLTDFTVRERVLIVEQELIEDYLEDSLTTTDREIFLSRHTQTPAQQQKLRITKSIKDWAVREAEVVPAATSSWSRLGELLRLRRAFIVPIAVTIAIIVAVVWLRTEQRNGQALAIEQELAQLNTPENLREVPPQTVALTLTPVTVRSVEPQVELKTNAGIRFVDLRLPWIQKERYSTYRAILHRASDAQPFTIQNLQAENDANAIRIRLPVHILSRGQYRLELRGIAAGGAPGSSEEYQFTVSG